MSWVHVLDAASSSRDGYADAPDAVSRAQRVCLCLPVIILSELSVCVLVPDSALISMCCNFHAPDAAARAVYGIAHISEATSRVCLSQ